MTLNLVKLCVGVDAVEDLQAHIDYSLADKKQRGLEEIQFHTTRMIPKRADELVDGGSLYWVFKGVILARQKVVRLDEVIGDAGVSYSEWVWSLEPSEVPA